MLTDENKALVRRLIDEVFNAHNLVPIDGYFLSDYVERIPLPPGMPDGVAGVKAFWGALFEAFPDFHYTIEDMVAEGDTVAIRLTARGTHRGTFVGIPATGKQVAWTETHIGRCAGGKLAEHWANMDQLGLLQQLGAIPMPVQAAGAAG
jgi:predicted ester cyclase